MLRMFAVLLGVLVLSAVSPARADIPDHMVSARAVVDACLGSMEMTEAAHRDQVCGCGAGFLAARMDDREYYIVGRLIPFYGMEDGRERALAMITAEGFQPEEVIAVGQKLQELAPLISATCDSL